MKREFLQELRVGESALTKDVVDAIMAEHGKDLQAHKQAAQQWEEKYHKAVAQQQEQLNRLTFDGYVKDAVTACRGRNLKAITALLELQALQDSEDPKSAVEQAVQALKSEHDYLFLPDTTPAPYAGGTGIACAVGETYPDTLAGALKERFERR